MTPCEELGYKVGDKFKEIKTNWFVGGSLITLVDDTMDDMPDFGGICMKSLEYKEYYIELCDVVKVI